MFCRPRWLACAGQFAAVFLLTLAGTQAADADEPAIESLITAAGNADDDQDRLTILRQLRARPDLPAQMQRDLDKLIEEVDLWLNAKNLSYWFPPFPFDEEFPVVIWSFTGRDLDIAKDSPLYPLTWLYRARYMSWSIIELGGAIDGYPDRRRKFYGQIRTYLEKYVARFPENRIARMYLGEPIPPAKEYPPVAGAPEWAVYKRENTERLTDIIHWWIDHRMQENGEFGGNWNDDVEMVNDDWGPIMQNYVDPKTNGAAQRFVLSLWNTPRFKDGYSDIYPLEDDVAHSHEETNKTILPMLELEPDSPLWWNRIHRIYELCAGDWSGRNERGRLQFRSNYLSPTRVNLEPRKAYDGTDHNGLLLPVLMLWERTGDEAVGQFILDRLETYLLAAQSTEAGKPAGILPVAIHWPDGGIGGLSGKWWDPGWVPADQLRSRPVRAWSPTLGGLPEMLRRAYQMTGDPKYLEPIWAQLRLRLAYLQQTDAAEPEPGSALWVGAQTGHHLDAFAALHREVTGSDEFAELIPPATDSSGDSETRWDARREELTAMLRDYARTLRGNFESYTSECRHTDRLFKMRRLWEYNKLYPDVAIPIISDRHRIHRDRSVRWLTSPREMAAIVLEDSSTSLVAELFHFGHEPRAMGVQFKSLEPGRYRCLLTTLAPQERVLSDEIVDLAGKRPKWMFDLPSRTPCRLQLLPAPTSAEETTGAGSDAVAETSPADDEAPGAPSASRTNPPSRPIPMIVDTDVCDDIDDIWTIALLLNCPELDIRLIATSVNDTTAKAKVVARMLQAMGRTDIPIAIGPVHETGYLQTWAYDSWADDFSFADYEGVVYEQGAEAVVDAIRAAPEGVVLHTIGPLTTVAAALKLDPAIAPKTRWLAMAGGVYRGYNAEEPAREYNVAAFRDAAETVVEAPWKETLIAPLDVAVVSLRDQHYQRFYESNSVASQQILPHYRASLLHSIARNHPELPDEDVAEQADQRVRSASSTLFDAAPIFMLLQPEAVRVETLPLRVSAKGYTLVDRTGAGTPIRCGTAWNDLPAFHDFLVERLTR